MKKLFAALSSVILGMVIIFSGCSAAPAQDQPVRTIVAYQVNESEDEPSMINNGLSDDDIALLALLTMAEAEDECEEGKRLVIDTVFNRIDSDEFPDTVYDVIFEPYQYPSMTNGRADVCEVRDDICRLVKEEWEHRLNSDCIYFQTDCFPEYGSPLFKVESHFFSGI